MTFRHSFLCLAWATFCAAGAWAQQYTITTFAGNATAGFSGDGGAAASAQLSSPNGIVLDSSGNLYIADSTNQRIRKISGGTITTIAGSSTSGYSGDGAAATSAQLFNPTGVAVDSSGNIYIADASNHVIRKISGSNISTVAGNHIGGYSGDGGAATNAQLDFPLAVALDSAGNLYIADSGNGVIREVSSSGTITTLVGGLYRPNGLAFDAAGNLYIADPMARKVFKCSGGVVSTVAGNGEIGFSGDNGPATEASLADPQGIAVDSAGYLYIADTVNSRIRKVSPSGIITTVAGKGLPVYYGDNGPATAAYLDFPRAVVVDPSGKVYIADTGSNTIRQLQVDSPKISANGLLNAASYTSKLSPGALATVFGLNFTGAGLQAYASLPLPDSLGGVSISVNGKPAPILYVNSTQVNFQIPWETSPGSAAITLSVNGVSSNTVNASLSATDPGLFFLSSGRAIVQNSDYTLNTSGNPAKVGSTIIAYVTGSGPVSPPVRDGAVSPASPLSKPTSKVSATIGGQPASAIAALAPGFVGVLQVNIVVPSGLTQGDYPLSVTIGGETSNSAIISVTP